MKGGFFSLSLQGGGFLPEAISSTTGDCFAFGSQ